MVSLLACKSDCRGWFVAFKSISAVRFASGVGQICSVVIVAFPRAFSVHLGRCCSFVASLCCERRVLFWFVCVINLFSIYVLIEVDIIAAIGLLSASIKSDLLAFSVGMTGKSLYLLFCRSRRSVVDIVCLFDGSGGWLRHSSTKLMNGC